MELEDYAELERCYDEVCHVTISSRGMSTGNVRVRVRVRSAGLGLRSRARRQSNEAHIWMKGSNTHLLSDRNSLIPSN